tara:strand:+ start:74 stop:1552 length:1479 start_codon:yes stop_codon:yes gene_type:complete
MKIFGFEITKALHGKAQEAKKLPELVQDRRDDAVTVSGGHYGHYLDTGDDNITNENALVLKYRDVAMHPEVDNAINDIIDQSIVSSEQRGVVALRLDAIDQPDKVKDEIREEFNHVIKLLKFNNNGTDIFRDWYVDGRLFFHMMIDTDNPKLGIQELRQIDPLNIKKAKEVISKIDKRSGIQFDEVQKTFYLLSHHGSTNTVRVDENMIAHAPSGLYNETGKKTISYLHKALKSSNQLRMLEDALVIYRLARAPERRIFYIDVGNMAKGKAEEYVQGLMNKYRNKLVYDVSTGDIRDDRRAMSMLEDFWLPRKEGGKGTEISTLSGGENLGQIDDVIFFQRKLYKSLNIPIGRLEPENAFSIGRATEINRDEVKFQKFVDKLRRKFSKIFFDILEVQCVLKGVLTKADWEEIREDISIDFMEDNYFSELKEFEILRERLEVLDQLETHIGVHYSNEWVRKNVLRLTDDEIEEQKKQIAAEKESGEIDDEDDL